ncbi:MAG: N-6 DNA methylase [Sedimentisphaerales bacterium]|nr:N-6 DNA methylase [Sedimentisphaerales bacterium]
MAEDVFNKYLSEINKAYLRGDATEHTHRPALKNLIEAINNKITAINEPKRIACGAPDLLVTFKKRTIEQTIGYIECKDIGVNLNQAEKNEQIKRYLSKDNLILTDYIEFRLYIDGKKQLSARLAEETGGKFKITEEGREKVLQLLNTFLSHEPLKISIAKELTVKMGDITKLLRDIIKNTFEHEQETGTLHSQYGAFKEVLIHDLTEKQFADMYAQTICYGLFSARCHQDDVTLFGKDKHAVFHGMDDKRKQFTRETAAYLLPKTNPFLRKTFGHIAGPELDDRIAWLVDDLVALLRNADMSSILRDFAKKTNRRDPVFHFYETFLAEYDKKLKKSRGVYFTPDEVVSYIVRSVDILLKEKFGLQRGLADNSKIQVEINIKNNGKEKEKKEVHRCLILDPAVGTGTFLYEVIEQIYSKFKQQKGSWSGYVKEHLLPRIFGFELMMAPYAICHMKLGLQLAEAEYDFESDERLGVYLTNTLEEAEEISRNIYAQWISEEARAANKVKKDLPIMVVLGNPPYSGISANRGEWITRLIDSYRQINGRSLGEKKIWVKNDYVKFIRFGQHRIEETGAGILAFITDHSYLDSPTFRGMRYDLLRSFNEIYLLNLHGNSKRREMTPDGREDKNVFDIQQGTAISLFIKNPNESERCIRYADLWGTRETKYKILLETDIKSTGWEQIEPVAPFYEFVPVNRKVEIEYKKGWKITDILKTGSNGIQTSRDELVISKSHEQIKNRFSRIADRGIDNSTIKSDLKITDSSFWNFAEARSKLFNDKNWKDHLKKYTYRPFDDSWIFASESFVHRLRKEVMQHLARENIALCVGRAGLVQSGEWDLIFCVNSMCDHNLFYRGSSMNFPLYVYSDGKRLFEDSQSSWPSGKEGRIPNLDKGFVNELTKKIGLKFVSDGVGDFKKTFGPEDVFDYIYGVLHSPEYRDLYAEFLKTDFPRIPWPKGRTVFRDVAKVGGQLVKLHLLEAEILEDAKQWPRFPVKGDSIVEKGYPTYVARADEPQKGKVYINKDQFFEGVTPDVWEFHIGGYQVCEKWLKDRRERELSYDDINHYQKIVVALGETIRLMKEPCLSEMFKKKTN